MFASVRVCVCVSVRVRVRVSVSRSSLCTIPPLPLLPLSPPPPALLPPLLDSLAAAAAHNLWSSRSKQKNPEIYPKRKLCEAMLLESGGCLGVPGAGSGSHGVGSGEGGNGRRLVAGWLGGWVAGCGWMGGCVSGFMMSFTCCGNMAARQER